MHWTDKTKILSSFIRKWGLSVGQSKGVTSAVILMCALLTTRCGNHRWLTENSTQTADSIVWMKTLTVKPMTVPLSQADLRLNLKDLNNLTPGARFVAQNGQAAVSVEKKDSIVYVTAVCDSLQILVESQKDEIFHLRRELEVTKEVKEAAPGFWEKMKNNTFYMIVGALLTLVIMFFKNKLWKKIKKTRN